jgi:hypothetical protein
MNRLFKFIASLSILCLASGAIAAELPLPKSVQDDAEKIASIVDQCKKLKSYIIKNKYPVTCDPQYLLYGVSGKSVASKVKPNIKIANYNLLHPGTSKTLFKDYALVAKVINTFDLVSAEEVLSMIGHDADVNADIDEYLSTKSDNSDLTQEVRSLYRLPGYLKILEELKKLDSSWSLLLSPRGDSALVGSVEEHVGFFFRSSLVSLKSNPYCEDNLKVKSSLETFGCLVNFGIKNKYVSRRPFMATFQAATFKFTIVASHVVFNFSGDEEQMNALIKDVFGVDGLENVGGGVNSVNFARFAEVKLTLEFIKKYSLKYSDNKIIFSSDTNLNPDIEYWNTLMSLNNGLKLLINEPTTLSPQRFNKNNEETFGVANSYDHFVLNKKFFNNCDDGKVYNYLQSPVGKFIEDNYLIRKAVPFNKVSNYELSKDEYKDLFDGEPPPEESEPTKLDYPLTKAAETKIKTFSLNFENFLKSQKTVKNDQIVVDSFQIPERIDGLKNRLFLKQLTNSFFYRVYQELLSDHLPAYITCTL